MGEGGTEGEAGEMRQTGGSVGTVDDDDLPALDLYADDEGSEGKKRRRRRRKKSK